MPCSKSTKEAGASGGATVASLGGQSVTVGPRLQHPTPLFFVGGLAVGIWTRVPPPYDATAVMRASLASRTAGITRRRAKPDVPSIPQRTISLMNLLYSGFLQLPYAPLPTIGKGQPIARRSHQRDPGVAPWQALPDR